LENSQQRLIPLQSGKTFILNLPRNQAWQAVMGLSAGPGIIAAALRNMIEIQVKKRYHRDALFGRPRGPDSPNKNGPFPKRPFNPKSTPCLSTHSEKFTPLLSVLIWASTLECGDLHFGFARVRYDRFGHENLLGQGLKCIGVLDASPVFGAVVWA
jgi:hypothetical protein